MEIILFLLLLLVLEINVYKDILHKNITVTSEDFPPRNYGTDAAATDLVGTAPGDER